MCVAIGECMTILGLKLPGMEGRSLKQWVKLLVDQVKRDEIVPGATQIAFNWTLSTFPVLLVLLSVISMFPIEQLRERMLQFVELGLPRDVSALILRVIGEVQSTGPGSLLSVGVLVTLYGASNSMMIVIRYINRTMDIRESRPGWKLRLYSLAMIGLFGGLVLSSLLLALFGDIAIGWLTRLEILGPVVGWVARIFRWVLIGAAMTVGIEALYSVAPCQKWKWGWFSPGSVFATVAIVTVSMGMDFYFRQFGRYNATYGSIGATVIFMIWLQVMSLILLLGSELNSLPSVKEECEQKRREREGKHLEYDAKTETVREEEGPGRHVA